MSCEPFAIVVGVGTVYLAAVGTAFPDTDETPASTWTALGSTDDKGVTVKHVRKMNRHFKGNSALVQKVTLEEASEEIAFTLSEITVERYAMVLDGATVTTTPAGSGTPGTKSFPITPPSSCATQFAMLIRGPSPLMDAYAQYEYPRVSSVEGTEIGYSKSDTAGLACAFEAFEDTNNAGRFGVYRAQAAAAT
jgi:hypothetical protein